MRAERHIITYPGFAEGASAKGLYKDIRAVASPETRVHILPFYYEDESTGEREVRSIEEHRNTLQGFMDSLDGEINVFGKCGGTRVVVSMDDEHMSRVNTLTLFNPPWKISDEILMRTIRGPGGYKIFDGSWVIPRNDNGDERYIVTPGYINDVSGTNLIERYREIARNKPTNFFVVRAMKDEVFPPIDLAKIGNGVQGIDIENGDHHFLRGESRQQVLGALAIRGLL